MDSAFHAQALERVAAMPGVSHAAFAWGVPLTGNSWPAEIRGSRPRRAARRRSPIASACRCARSRQDYFAVMGMRLVEGRAVPAVRRRRGAAGGDRQRGRSCGATSGPRRRSASSSASRRQRQADRHRRRPRRHAHRRLRDAPEPELYLPFWQYGAFSKHLVCAPPAIRWRWPPHVRAAVRASQPTAAVEHVTTMAEIRRESTAAQTFALRLLAGFAVVATLLAAGRPLRRAVAVGRGAHEGDWPCARRLGARRDQVVGLVLGEGARLVAVGVACGIAGGGARRPPARDAAVRRRGHRRGARSPRRPRSSRSSPRQPAWCRPGAPAAPTSMPPCGRTDAGATRVRIAPGRPRSPGPASAAS